MPMRQFAGDGNCHLLYLKKQKQKKPYKLPASRGALFIMFCLCSVVPAAFSAPPISPGNIVINAHLHGPAYAVPTPLTAFPSSACPTACSWASQWPDRLPPAPWDSGRVRSLLICDNNPSSKM